MSVSTGAERGGRCTSLQRVPPPHRGHKQLKEEKEEEEVEEVYRTGKKAQRSSSSARRSRLTASLLCCALCSADLSTLPRALLPAHICTCCCCPALPALNSRHLARRSCKICKFQHCCCCSRRRELES